MAKIKILAVCGMGLGSSLIMRMGIEKALKELGVEGTVEVADLSSMHAQPADFIFASSEIAGKIKHSAKVVGVKNIMDRNALKEQLKEVLAGREE